MVKQPQQVQVEVHSGLVAETPLLLGDDVKAIRSLYLMNNPAPTFGLNNNAEVINTEILSIPKEIFVNEVYEIKFSNGYILNCTEGTPIMTTDSWTIVKDLKVGDKILGAMYNANRGIIGRVFNVESVRKEFKTLGVPAYFFMAKDGNILLPHVGDNEITFICVSQ